MKFIIATNNEKKKKELSAILENINIDAISLSQAGITAKIEETGATFEENALLKAREICKIANMPTIADDSGLMVEDLNGEPGVFSARYGGEKCKNDADRYNFLLKNMENIKDNRKAKFVCCIACVFEDGKAFTVMGECEGEILFEPRGQKGFGYDPVFYLKQYDKTMAEIDSDIKNKISHRAKALLLFKEKIKKYL